jgi:hypothetical protein
MSTIKHGARRIILHGNFEFFGRGEPTGDKEKGKPQDDENQLPPAHAFFTSFASRPVLMTYGLRILIPLRSRGRGRRALVHDQSQDATVKKPS